MLEFGRLMDGGRRATHFAGRLGSEGAVAISAYGAEAEAGSCKEEGGKRHGIIL